jgi:hypothetical protein
VGVTALLRGARAGARGTSYAAQALASATRLFMQTPGLTWGAAFPQSAPVMPDHAMAHEEAARSYPTFTRLPGFHKPWMCSQSLAKPAGGLPGGAPGPLRFVSSNKAKRTWRSCGVKCFS